LGGHAYVLSLSLSTPPSPPLSLTHTQNKNGTVTPSLLILYPYDRCRKSLQRLEIHSKLTWMIDWEEISELIISRRQKHKTGKSNIYRETRRLQKWRWK
jgi:hypothetical protein